MTSETFAGTRGRKIHWTSWEPADPRSAGGVIVIVHGFGEHSGRYEHVAQRLTRDGWAVFALDHHGHGRSEGPRGRISFPEAVADIDHLVDLAVARHPGQPVFLLGHSMGGALALRYALAHEDRLAGLILSGPLVQVEGRAAAQLLGRVLGRVAPNLPLARLDPNLVSRDPEVVRAYVEDPLVFHQPLPAATVSEFLRQAATLPAEVDPIRLPTLLMYGTEDRLCAPQGAVLVSQRIGATDLTTKAYDGLYHEILNEPEQELVLNDVCGWLAAHSAHCAQTVRA
jgi:acylglycerol lipase